MTQESKMLLFIALGVMAALAAIFTTAYCCLRSKEKKEEAVWKDALHERVQEVHTHTKAEIERRKTMSAHGCDEDDHLANLQKLHPELKRAFTMNLKAMVDQQRMS
jgi:sensor domain CHASE-containing protein